MSLLDAKDAVYKFSKKVFQQNPAIISVKNKEGQWTVEMEVEVYDEYMRKKPFIETYKVELDDSYSIISFSRLRMRVKGTTEEFIEG